MASVSPILAIERLLDGKTTLKTRRTTHKNIICIGTEVLDHIKMVMNEDKEKAIELAVEEAAKKAAIKLRSETELLQQILVHEKKKEIREQKKIYKLQIKEVKRKCEFEEEQRANEAHERYQLEKTTAVEEAMEKAKSEREAKIAQALEQVKKELLEEARIDKEKAIAVELKRASEEALRTQQSAILETQRECNKKMQEEIQRLTKEYTEKINELKQRIEYTQKMLEIEKRRKEDIQQTFMDLKEDYKRFQNYTGVYHSDYLLP